MSYSTFKSEAGTEIGVETVFDPKKVDKLLKRCLKRELYADLKAKAEEYEEVFLELTFGAQADLPQVRHFLIHLDRRPNNAALIPGAVRGNFVIIFYVDKDKLEEIRPMVKYLKGTFKNANEWENTTQFAVDPDKVTDLPTFRL